MEDNILEEKPVPRKAPEADSEELHLESFKRRIIQKYAKLRGERGSQDDSGQSSPQALTPSKSSISAEGVEDFYKKQKFNRKQSFISQKTVFEENLLQKVKILENKDEKHLHLLKSAFLANDMVDKDFDQVMLIDAPPELRRSRREPERPGEEASREAERHNKSLLGSMESSCDSEHEKESRLKGQIEALQLMRLKHEENSFLRVIERTSLEKLERQSDSLPLPRVRRAVKKGFYYFTDFCETIVKNPLFEFVSFVIIIFNTVVLAMDDPVETEKESLSDKLDAVFLALYSLELLLKMLGFGRRFFLDFWNLFDLVIVLFSMADLFLKEIQYNLTSLRSLRVLRPLKTISTIKKLKILILTIFSSIPFLLEILLILGFVYLMFAIGGLHIFQGVLKKKCFDPLTGSAHAEGIICDNDDICPSGFLCGKMFSNPNWGVTNFDNIGSSLLMVFQVTTLEGWFPIMESLIGAFSGFIDAIIVVYFIMLIFIGNFFILNLTLAVIIVKFNESHENKKEKSGGIQHRLDCECRAGLNFSKMHRCGYFSHLRLDSKQKRRLENKLVDKRPKSLIKVNKHFRFKYKAKRVAPLRTLRTPRPLRERSLSQHANEFVRGIRFQEDTHQHRRLKLAGSMMQSAIERDSRFLTSGNQSLFQDSACRTRDALTGRLETDDHGGARAGRGAARGRRSGAARVDSGAALAEPVGCGLEEQTGLGTGLLLQQHLPNQQRQPPHARPAQHRLARESAAGLQHHDLGGVRAADIPAGPADERPDAAVQAAETGLEAVDVGRPGQVGVDPAVEIPDYLQEHIERVPEIESTAQGAEGAQGADGNVHEIGAQVARGRVAAEPAQKHRRRQATGAARPATQTRPELHGGQAREQARVEAGAGQAAVAAEDAEHDERLQPNRAAREPAARVEALAGGAHTERAADENGRRVHQARPEEAGEEAQTRVEDEHEPRAQEVGSGLTTGR